jgi:hypothetical protein
MSLICFLLDEHVPPFILAQLARMEPDLRVYVINDGNAPVRGTLDPDILIWIETHGCLLVTNNRASMPGILPITWRVAVISPVSSNFPDTLTSALSSMISGSSGPQHNQANSRIRSSISR